MTSISDTTRPMCANFRFGADLAAASCVIAPPPPSRPSGLIMNSMPVEGRRQMTTPHPRYPKSKHTAPRQSLTRLDAAQEYLERSGCFLGRVYIDVMSCIGDRHQY